MKLILLLLLIASTIPLFAQEIEVDSSKIKKIAVTDADNKFRINRIVRQAYRQKRLSSTSDYFKPTFQTTSDSKLLNDSGYVRIYKHTAFESTVDQIKLNRTRIIIVGVVAAGVVALVVVVVKLAEAFASALADGITNSVK